MSASGDHERNMPGTAKRAVTRVRAVLAVLGLSLFVASPASADSEGIPFGGAVSTANVCTIVVTQTGIFVPNAAKTIMSSKFTGGRPGIANVISGSNYYVSASTYPFFTSYPPDGNTNTTFQVRHSGQNISRGRTYSERPGSTRVRLRTGNSTTRVSLHLIATRTGTPFPAGNYTGEVVLRCE